MTLPSRTAEDFFDTEYRNYALYTISSRAIPSLVDGFKPAQRKIAFAANKLWKTGNEKPMKVFQLGGQAAALSFFHHGSLDGTIIGMTQDFKNSMPIFQGIGQFGSLRSPEAGAPRYVGVKFNDNFRLLYKDFELVAPQFEEGEEIEPKFFLPIIPTVLLNGGSGIAVGFATNILNRHPLDLIDATVDVLKGGSTNQELKPWIRGFWGDVKAQPASKGKSWIFSGAYSVKNSTQVEITEIPPGFTYEKYDQHLESLIEKEILHSYEDHSSERIRYVLRFHKTALSEILAGDRLDQVLKMTESATENITTLDSEGNLRIFDSAKELLLCFVALRLEYYVKRKDYILQELSSEISVLEDKVLFLKHVIEGTLEVGKKSKGALVQELGSMGLRQVDGGFDYLLSMPIYSLTSERYADLQEKLKNKVSEKTSVEGTAPVDMYLQDLQELRKKLAPKSAPAPKTAGDSNAPQMGMVQNWLGGGAPSEEEGEKDSLSFLESLASEIKSGANRKNRK